MPNQWHQLSFIRLNLWSVVYKLFMWQLLAFKWQSWHWHIIGKAIAFWDANVHLITLYSMHLRFLYSGTLITSNIDQSVVTIFCLANHCAQGVQWYKNPLKGTTQQMVFTIHLNTFLATWTGSFTLQSLIVNIGTCVGLITLTISR